MKKIIIITILCSWLSIAAAMKMEPQISLEGYYHSNLLSLSDSNYQRYLDGEIGSYYDVDSADDFITNLAVNLKTKNKLFGHTNLVNLNFDYDLYATNKVFDKMTIGIDTKQYFNRYLDLKIGYSWSPEIYVNNYTSVWDDARHKYTYSKNSFFTTMNWNLNKQVTLRYDLDFAQLYYNQYFTEYDAVEMENGAKLIWKLANLDLRLGYSYKLSEAQAEEAFDGIAFDGVIKDGSYDANKYKFSFAVPKLFSLANKDVRWYTSVLWEQRYFDSANMADTYHYGREAERLTVDTSMRYRLNESTSLKILGSFQNRNTDSIYEQVAAEKTYDAYQVGFNLEFEL